MGRYILLYKWLMGYGVCLMALWTAQIKSRIWSFQIRFELLSYMVLNQIQIRFLWKCDFSLNTRAYQNSARLLPRSRSQRYDNCELPGITNKTSSSRESGWNVFRCSHLHRDPTTPVSGSASTRSSAPSSRSRCSTKSPNCNLHSSSIRELQCSPASAA